MSQDDKPLISTLTTPPRTELPEDSRHKYWLKLADQALIAAREEQARIREKIKPQIDRYQRIMRSRHPPKVDKTLKAGGKTADPDDGV